MSTDIIDDLQGVADRQSTDIGELRARVARGELSLYAGFDPTGPRACTQVISCRCSPCDVSSSPGTDPWCWPGAPPG